MADKRVGSYQPFICLALPLVDHPAGRPVYYLLFKFNYASIAHVPRALTILYPVALPANFKKSPLWAVPYVLVNFLPPPPGPRPQPPEITSVPFGSIMRPDTPYPAELTIVISKPLNPVAIAISPITTASVST